MTEETGRMASPDGKPPSASRSLLVVAFYCLLWLAISTSLVLVNRHLIVNGVPYPACISFLGQGTAFVCAGLVLWYSRAKSAAAKSASEAPEKEHLLSSSDRLNTINSEPPPLTWWFWTTRVLPVGVAQGAGIVLSNATYLLLTVAFIEMSRAALPFLTLMALWVTGLQIPSNSQIASVLIAGFGCGISAYGEAHLVLKGVLILCLGYFLEICRMLLLQYLMQARKMSPWQTIFTVAGPSAASLLTIVCAMEGHIVKDEKALANARANWPAVIAAAFLGVCTLYATNVVIQLSSATTVRLLAVVRGPIIVMTGMLLFNEMVAPLQLFGYTIAMGGLVWYSLSMPAAHANSAHHRSQSGHGKTSDSASPMKA